MANATETERAERHGGAGRYLAVWAALAALTALTYLVRRTDMVEPWHLIAALAIACAKASLVALFFMHLWYHRGTTRLVFATSLVFVALLIGLVVADNVTRFPYANPPGEGRRAAAPSQGPSAPARPRAR